MKKPSIFQNYRWHVHSASLNLISILQSVCLKQLCLMRKPCLCCVLFYYRCNSSHRHLHGSRLRHLFPPFRAAGKEVFGLLVIFDSTDSNNLRVQVDRELHKWVRMITESASHPSENRMSVQSGDLYIWGRGVVQSSSSSHQAVEEVLEAQGRDMEVRCQARSAHNPAEGHSTCWTTGMLQRSK